MVWLLKEERRVHLYTVSVPADDGRLDDAEVLADRHVFADVLPRADAADGAAHVVLVRQRADGSAHAQNREHHVALEDVEVPRHDAPFLWHLQQNLQEENPLVRIEPQCSGSLCL